MFLARFSYEILPVNRERALELIRQELEAARSGGLNARLLIPLRPGLRSLNVAQAAAMVLGEALRQTKGFPGE